MREKTFQFNHGISSSEGWNFIPGQMYSGEQIITTVKDEQICDKWLESEIIYEVSPAAVAISKNKKSKAD